MSVSQQSLLSSLESLIPGRTHVADEKDEVVGVQPQVVVEPVDEDEVAALLTYADKEGLKVLVRGGGTQLAMGFPPTGGDIVLSTARLNTIVEHAPHDLTVTVQAGLPLVRLQNALAETRQWLALDPVLDMGATMGGVVATNASGARRLRYGGVRDQIIGVRVVLADGTIAKGGGKVVKNVAGYDLPKLFTGSLGTLGVIVEATFRLYPLADASRTVLFSSTHLPSLCTLAVRIIGSTLAPTIVDIFGATSEAGQYTMAVRFETGREAAEAQCATLTGMIHDTVDNQGMGQQVEVLQDEDEVRFWAQMSGRMGVAGDIDDATTHIELKASVLPTDVAGWLEHLEAITRDDHVQVVWRTHAGHGIIFAVLRGDAEALMQTTNELRRAATEKQGSVVVQEASAALLQQVDVWGPSPALEVMRRIKARFDPHGTLNPGRFIGRI